MTKFEKLQEFITNNENPFALLIISSLLANKGGKLKSALVETVSSISIGLDEEKINYILSDVLKQLSDIGITREWQLIGLWCIDFNIGKHQRADLVVLCKLSMRILNGKTDLQLVQDNILKPFVIECDKRVALKKSARRIHPELKPKPKPEPDFFFYKKAKSSFRDELDEPDGLIIDNEDDVDSYDLGFSDVLTLKSDSIGAAEVLGFDIEDGQLVDSNSQRVTKMLFGQDDNGPIARSVFWDKNKDFYFTDSFVYFMSYGFILDSFVYVDGQGANISPSNILPENFIVEKCNWSNKELNNTFAIDQSSGGMVWQHRYGKNIWWNRIFPDTSAVVNFKDQKLVNLDGVIVYATEILKIIIDNVDILDGDSEETHFAFIEAEKKYGRDAIYSCFYCGDNSSMITRDHVIPISYQSVTRSYNPRDTVPCCAQCNSLLGNKPLFTVEDRAAYLADRLARKYSRAMTSGAFTQTEIDDFGDRLKSMVVANINLKSFVISRIDHCHKVAGSLYDAGKISHLRGLTTIAKRSAYRLLNQFLGYLGAESNFIIENSDSTDSMSKDIKDLLAEKIHIDVSMQLKYDLGLPFDISIRKLRIILNPNTLKSK